MTGLLGVLLVPSVALADVGTSGTGGWWAPSGTWTWTTTDGDADADSDTDADADSDTDADADGTGDTGGDKGGCSCRSTDGAALLALPAVVALARRRRR